MKLLLDTCTFLWFTTGSPDLSATAKQLVLDSNNELFLSAASIWEIAVKYAKGKLPLAEPPSVFVPFYRELSGIAVLELREDAALHAASLPLLHTDPFDRMLICQSIVHGIPILSPDEKIAQYRVKMIW